MKVPKKYPRVEVHWEDATIPNLGWVALSDALATVNRRKVRCTSVGFLLADDKRGVVLANSVHADEVAGTVIIPRRQVIKVERLRVAPPRRADQ